MMLAFLMYLMMQKQADCRPSPSFHGPHTEFGITTIVPMPKECVDAEKAAQRKEFLKIAKQGLPEAYDCIAALPELTFDAVAICIHPEIEPTEYPAIQEPLDVKVSFDGERFYCTANATFHSRLDEDTKEFVRWCEGGWLYTCKSPDTEVLEFTVSGRAFCRKVAP